MLDSAYLDFNPMTLQTQTFHGNRGQLALKMAKGKISAELRLEQDPVETNFYVATLAPDVDMVNGAIDEGKHYIIAEYFKQDAFEIWDQSAASNIWTITHTLDKKPSITVVDSGDNKVYGKIDYIDNNTLTITFNAAFSGKAYLN